VAALDCILSLLLILWYQTTIAPTLSSCSPVHLSPLASISMATTSCECASGFTDPPSLRATVRHFVGVSDCSLLSRRIAYFHWILFTLYSAGTGLAVLVGGLAGKRLHVLGVCGNSGVYSVTPEPTTPTTPTTPVANDGASSSGPSIIDRVLFGAGRQSASRMQR